MLYIVATPIGNLEDITLRALRILQEVDFILCEDTRQTQKLTVHYEISTPLKSYHKFNEKKSEEAIISELKSGKKIALLSDAGMPTISDPGGHLIEEIFKEKIPYTCIPGPSAVTTALALGGYQGGPFHFYGFFPKKEGEIKKIVAHAENQQGISIFFLPPHHVKKTLCYFSSETKLTLLREMTKKFEEIASGTKETLSFTEKGEMVLLVFGKEKELSFEESEEKRIFTLLQEELSHSQAAKIMGKISGRGKKWYY